MSSFKLSMNSFKISLFIAAQLLFILPANRAPVKAGCLFKDDLTHSKPGTLFLNFFPLLSRYDLAIILRSKESKGKPNSAHFVIAYHLQMIILLHMKTPVVFQVIFVDSLSAYW